MSVIRATDYIESLQKCCEITEKFYEQAQNDLVAAERKRDEAKAIMDEAFSRLKEAKKKIDTNSSDVSPVISSTKKVVKRTVHVKGKHRSASATRERKVEGDKTSSKDPTTNNGSIEKQTGKELESNGSPRLKRSSSLDARRKKSIKAKSDLERASSHRGSFNSTGSPKRKVLTPEQRKKKLMARENPSVRNLNIVDLPNTGTPVLEICKGRSSEWYESNIDCATFGLVKRFYQAALGTKTSSATNKVFISSILLDDEWNDLIGKTSQVQELYIGTSSSSDGKETLRDRAARALVQPPQKEPIALFFAPRNKLDTDKVYYGGHWKVIAGHMLEPPQTVKGQPRQCLVKFVFSGIESNLVKAINDGN